MLKHKIVQRLATAGLSFCVLICILIGLCGGLFGLQDSDAAFAFNSGRSGSTTISELLVDNSNTTGSDQKVFDGKQFWTLIDALASDTEDIRDVASLSDKNAQAIRDVNGGKDIYVTIDGNSWTVTDLRKLSDGRVIATFWLTSSTQTSQWNLWSEHGPESAYPSNMYSTSYVRAHALNSGGCGYVATEADAQEATKKLTTIPQNASHAYAKFTMSGIAGSLTDYIVQPKDVAYQETETIRTYNGSWKTCSNEAWGTPDLENYHNEQMNYSDKSHYSEWSSDYLWLPSIAEVGYSGVSGVWDLSDAQRSGGTDSWLRSGHFDNSNYAFLNTAGSTHSTFATANLAVRPAFHLDLTQAAEATTQPIFVPTLGANEIGRAHV